MTTLDEAIAALQRLPKQEQDAVAAEIMTLIDEPAEGAEGIFGTHIREAFYVLSGRGRSERTAEVGRANGPTTTTAIGEVEAPGHYPENQEDTAFITDVDMALDNIRHLNRWEYSVLAQEIERLRTRPEQANESPAWQPIETAPRDGSYILLAAPSGYTTTPLRAEIGHYDAEYRPLQPWVTHSNDSFTDGGEMPTLWMPLPHTLLPNHGREMSLSNPSHPARCHCNNCRYDESMRSVTLAPTAENGDTPEWLTPSDRDKCDHASDLSEGGRWCGGCGEDPEDCTCGCEEGPTPKQVEGSPTPNTGDKV